MTRKQHGVLSLVLLFLSMTIGVFSIFQSSMLLTITYLGASTILFMVIVFSFCSKCPCRLNSCGHILPGKLTKLLPNRQEGKYNLIDFVGVIIPMLIIIAYPQFWLAKDILLLTFFWVLVIFTLVEIRLMVCKECKNNYCPLNNNMN